MSDVFMHKSTGARLAGLAIASVLVVVSLLPAAQTKPDGDEEPDYRVELLTARKGFDGKTCWVHARAGAIPAKALGMSSGVPLVVMTTQKLLLSGSDVFYGLHEMRTEDAGKTWTEPARQTSLARQQGGENVEIVLCDFTPQWHAPSGKLLGIGHTAYYSNNSLAKARPRQTGYSVYDPAGKSWSKWKTLGMPDLPKFKNAGAGSVQRVDLPDGDILLPIYFKVTAEKQYSATVVRCRFDGETLRYVEHGNEMTINVQRGFVEPSLAKFEGRFFLTLRNDEHGHVTSGPDGLHFDEPRRWTFDDGSDLGNYNTQQHWVTHCDGLFLVYTRRGGDNDHIFRHRAPLFIARIDPERLCVIRSTERILVPERGTRIGNFGVVKVSPQETWVTTTEWMQPHGVEKYGSDNSIYVAKIRWSRPNE
jgi:hypothetical protein